MRRALLKLQDGAIIAASIAPPLRLSAHPEQRLLLAQENMEVQSVSSALSGFNIDEVIRHMTAQAVSSVDSGVSLTGFRGLDSALDQAAAHARAVGDLPPKPATLRAAIGFLLVRGVRRMLFWYTPGVRGFHESVIASLTQVRASLGLLEDQIQLNEPHARIDAQRAREALAALQEKMEHRVNELVEQNRQERVRFHDIQEENTNRIEAIQQQVVERLDRIEGEVSRLSVRADVLVKLQFGMEQLSQRIDEMGGLVAAARREMSVRVVEHSQEVVEELRPRTQP
jgi:hypothetical protein